MDGVLQVEVPTAPLWPDARPFGVLMPEGGPGALFVGSSSSGVLQIEGDDAFLVPAQTQTFMLSAGEQGPPAPQQIFVQDAGPVGGATPLLWFDTDAFPSAPGVAQMKVWRP